MPEKSNTTPKGSLRDSLNKSLILTHLEQRHVIVHTWYSGSESPSEDETDYEEKEIFKAERESTITPEFLRVIKALKFLKMGCPESCVVALSSLINCDLTNSYNLQRFFDDNSLEVLVNLLEVNHERCVLATLQLFKMIIYDLKVVRNIVDLGISTRLIELVGHMVPEFNMLACDILASMARCRLAARNIRKSNGIQVIVSLLNIKKETLLMDYENLSEENKMKINVTRSAAYALWYLCHYTKNKKIVARIGVIPIMVSIILSRNRIVGVPMTGMLCECSSELMFQIAIESEGLVGILLGDMKTNDKELKTLCATALANAAGHQIMVSHMIRRNGGVDLVMKLLEDMQNERTFVAALLNLLWKSAQAIENVKRYQTLSTSYTVVKYVDTSDMLLRVPATGAVAELAKARTCRSRLIETNALKVLITNLGSTNTKLLINTAKAIGELIKNNEGMEQMQKNDGVRLLWSLLKNPSESVVSEALRSLAVLVRNADDAGELVRSIDSSLPLLVKMLKSKDSTLLADVCQLISQVAKDEENLTVMTEHGIIQELCNLLSREGEKIQNAFHGLNNFGKGMRFRKESVEEYSKYEMLREEATGDKYGLRKALSQVVSVCSTTHENKIRFGMSGAIAYLVQFLKSTDKGLQSRASNALKELSFAELNCVQMHLCGAVPIFLEIVGDCDEATTIFSAACLKNIRCCVMGIERKKDVCADVV